MRFIFVVVGFGLSLLAYSQQQPSAQGPPRYDKNGESTYKGSIVDVQDRPSSVTGGTGTRLLIRTADEKVLEVHLGGARLVHEYGLSLRAGDAIEITGVKVHLAGADAILARKMKRGSQEFVFRDNEGNPIW